MDRRTAWGAGILAFLAALAAAGWLLYDSLLPLFLAFALAYAATPAVRRLERLGLSRTAGVSLLMASLLLLLVVGIGSVIPLLVSDGRAFASDFPGYVRAAVAKANELGERYGFQVPAHQQELIDRAGDLVRSASMSALKPVAAFAGRFLSGVVGLVLGALNVMLIPVFFFYVLRDLPALKKWAASLVPARHRGFASARLEMIDRVFSGYIRGQVSVALILAAVFSVGLTLLDVRFGLLIGIVSGLLNIIPYLGQLTGVGLALLMALVDFTGWGRLLAVPVFFAAVNYVEGTFLTPRIVGDKVGLSPVETILALIIGGQLAGFLGLLVAIPIGGCLKALVLDFLEAYKGSEFFRTGRD